MTQQKIEMMELILRQAGYVREVDYWVNHADKFQFKHSDLFGESPSTSQSLQEAAEAYIKERCPYHDHDGEYPDPDIQCICKIGQDAWVAGWNARDSQQTGALLLTRELHDKIWNDGYRSAFYDPAPGTVGFSTKEADRETFYKSLNL